MRKAAVVADRVRKSGCLEDGEQRKRCQHGHPEDAQREQECGRTLRGHTRCAKTEAEDSEQQQCGLRARHLPHESRHPRLAHR